MQQSSVCFMFLNNMLQIACRPLHLYVQFVRAAEVPVAIGLQSLPGGQATNCNIVAQAIRHAVP